MKKLITFLCLVLAVSAQGQKLKDKLNEKVNAVGDKVNGAPEATNSTLPLSSNQYEMVEPFTKPPKLWYSELKDGFAATFFVSEASTGLGSFGRNAEGKVTSIKSYMTPNFPEFPTSYTGSGKDMQTFFIQDYCFVLKMYGELIAKPEDVDRLIGHEGIFDRIISLNKDAAKNITFTGAKDLIRNYLTESKKGVDAINAQKAQAAEALRKQYSIKDKKVKSIAIETTQEFVRYKESAGYKIVATLEDGTVIKAGSGEPGFMDDYNVVVTGIEGGDGTTVYNQFKPTPTDKITLTVTSKYHPGKTATKIFKMKYEVADTFGDAAFKFSSQRAEPPYNGIDTRIEIKQVKNSLSGETLLEYRIYDMASSKAHFAFKCSPETPVEMGVNGRRITSEAKGWGQTGADGGKIKVVVDPSVTVSYNLITNVSGARGQEGTSGDGQPGRDGSVETVKQKVSF